MKKFFSIMIIVFSISFLNAQFTINNQGQEKEEDGYLVYFEDSVSVNEIDSIMELYNSYEVWITKYSKVRYWKVKSFPFTINDSTIVNDMNGFYDSWINDNDEPNKEKETNIGSISYNYILKKEIGEIILDTEPEYNDNICTEYYSPTVQGNNNILIDILDTGIDMQNPILIDGNIIGQYNFISNSINAQDDNGHGSHITSTILGINNVGNNNISIFESKTHNAIGKGRLSDIVRAIDHSIEIGANIINASWSFYAKESTKKTPVEVAIETAGKYGVLFIAAAGNDVVDNDTDTLKAYPASYKSDYILSVSSNACDTSLSYFSNYGYEYSDICAIGENVPGFVLNNQMALLSGTSQSTAYVSAIAANIGTHLAVFDPIEVKRLILDGAAYSDKLNKTVKTEGIVDINNSLALIQPDLSFRNDNYVNITDMNVYPNPFKSDLKLFYNSKKNENINIDLFDINGSLVLRSTYFAIKGENVFELNDLTSIIPGIYYIKSGSTIKKIIKVN